MAEGGAPAREVRAQLPALPSQWALRRHSGSRNRISCATLCALRASTRRQLQAASTFEVCRLFHRRPIRPSSPAPTAGDPLVLRRLSVTCPSALALRTSPRCLKRARGAMPCPRRRSRWGPQCARLLVMELAGVAGNRWAAAGPMRAYPLCPVWTRMTETFARRRLLALCPTMTCLLGAQPRPCRDRVEAMLHAVFDQEVVFRIFTYFSPVCVPAGGAPVFTSFAGGATDDTAREGGDGADAGWS